MTQSMRVLNYVINMMSEIERHLDKPVNLNPFVEQFNVTEVFLRKHFLSLVSETPEDYLHRLRMEKALYLLLDEKVAKNKIYLTVGMASNAIFWHEFEKFASMDVDQFIAQTKQNFGRFHDVLYHARSSIKAGSMENPFLEQSLEEALNDQQSVESLSDHIEVKYIPQFEVYYNRHIGHYWHAYKPWIKLFMVPRIGMKLLNKDFTRIGVVQDYPGVTPINSLRYDACLPKSLFKLPSGFPQQSLGGGKYLVCSQVQLKHVDMVRQLVLTTWLKANNLQFRYAPSISYIKLNKSISSPLESTQTVVDLAIPVH